VRRVTSAADLAAFSADAGVPIELERADGG
jgi:hypothetical protein